MAANTIKISFTLDEQDARYFRGLYRTAKKHAKEADAPKTVKGVKRLIGKVRSAKKAPNFVQEAIQTLEDLIDMIEDADYELPAKVTRDAVAGLTYFANPNDVIPDHVPGLGYLDDAIMMKLVEEEFKHELWAFRRFRAFRDGAEQRPWTKVARERLPRRLTDYRKSLRSKVEERKKAEALKRGGRKGSKSGGASRGFKW